MFQQFLKVIQSSVAKKQIMGVTGLLLCGFLISHLAGNCLIYVGTDAFNKYAHALISNPFIYVAEGILLAIFLVHLALAIRLTIENRAARPVNYYMKVPTGRGANFASSTMPYTGMLILIFLVLHIWQFKFGPYYEVMVEGVTMRDLYRLLLEYFSSPLAVAWYIFCMLALGIHVSHGFWSAFQSLGFNHPKYTPALRVASKAFAVIVTIGFSALPIYCYLQGGR
jgi:succinate dehydrogenase / fumarate reductase, cytochrome b subunit